MYKKLHIPSNVSEENGNNIMSSAVQIQAYRTLDADGVRDFIAAHPALAQRLGGPFTEWSVREVSDGNLNMVWLLHGSHGSLCVKQSLPHVRVDPAWKMPLDRTFFEAEWLRAATPFVSGGIPDFLHFDQDMYVLVTECLDDCVIFSRLLSDGQGDPIRVAREIGRLTASLAVGMSYLSSPFEKVWEQERVFLKNKSLTRITVDLIFTDPYADHPRNHFHPALAPLVERLRTDRKIHRAVCALQQIFLTSKECLLHGDLHAGSIMVGNDKIAVIDGEFALSGPVGFDCGLFIGSLVMAAFSAETVYREQIFQSIDIFKESFRSEFLGCWSRRPDNGDLAPRSLSGRDQEDAFISSYLEKIFREAKGFSALEIIRRLTGYAHTPYFAHLPEAVSGERQAEALSFALSLLTEDQVSGG